VDVEEDVRLATKTEDRRCWSCGGGSVILPILSRRPPPPPLFVLYEEVVELLSLEERILDNGGMDVDDDTTEEVFVSTIMLVALSLSSPILVSDVRRPAAVAVHVASATVIDAVLKLE